MVSHGRIDRFALDPVLNRPLGVSTLAVAALEMRRYLHTSGRAGEECAAVAARNREHARTNPRASYADVVDPSPTFDPLTREQSAESVDGCVVVVLRAGAHGAVSVDGVGWGQDAPSLESRSWDAAVAVERAGEMAFAQAAVTAAEVDVAEVDDTFAFKQLQHLDALGLAGLDGSKVNRSGGALGEGYLHEANGLARFLACVEQLRADEGRIGIAQSWRGVPSSSGAVALLRKEGA